MPESQILLKYVTDESSLKNTLNASKQLLDYQEALTKSSGELSEAQKETIDTAKAMQKAFDDLARMKQFDAIAKNASSLQAETKDADKAVEILLEDLKQIGATDREIADVVKQFDRLNTAAAAAAAKMPEELGPVYGPELPPDYGKTQSRGSLVGISRGVSRFRGTDLNTLGGQAEAGLGLAEIGSALPEIKDRAAEVVEKLTGPNGIAGSMGELALQAGVVGLALAAVGAALVIFTLEAKKRAEELRKAFEAERDVALEAARGDITKEIAEERIKTLQAENEAEKKLIEERKQQLLEAFKEGEFSPEYQRSIDTSTEAIKKNEAEIQALTKTLESGTLATEEAAKAQEQLDTVRLSAQQILQDARDKEAGITPQMRTLQEALSQGVLSAAEASEAEALLAKMREDTAGSTEDAKKAEAERQKAMQEWVAQQERIAQISENYASAVANAARGASQATQDAGRKLKDSFADIRTGAGRQLADDAIKAKQDELDLKRKQYEDEQKLIRDHQRAMRDIIKNANRDQEGLLAERDFLSLDQLSKQTKREIEDQQQADKDAQDDQQRANTEELRDFQQQQQRVRAERLRDYERSITDTRTQNQRELRDIQINKQRQLQQATEARNKELQLAQEGINRKLKLEAEYWRRSAALIPGGNGGTTAAGATGGMGSVEDFVLSTIGAIGLT
jgi:hypothetical protein